MEKTFWKKCSSCKGDIALNQQYYACSVSTCNGQRTGLIFCSVSCWERHLPFAKHRDAGAIEKTAPRSGETPAEGRAEDRAEGTRRIVRSTTEASVSASTSKEVLIVASKLKSYVKERADMNTSASVMDILSDIVRALADQAIDNGRKDGRKTVLDRDFH